MKLLSKREYDNGVQEVTLEKNYLLFKIKSTYRKFPGGAIMKFKEPNSYWKVGVYEWFDLNPFFKIK